MADAYVEEIHFRETSQLLTKREISAITGMIFLKNLNSNFCMKNINSHLKAIFYFDSRPLGQKNSFVFLAEFAFEIIRLLKKHQR